MKRMFVAAWCIGATALAVSVSCGPLSSPKKPQPVLASTTLDAERGKSVFADDFKNARSGWSTATTADGSSAIYADDGYVVVAKRAVDHVLHSPYALALPQISVSVTATLSATSPKGSAPGVGCARGPSEKTIKYTFLVAAGGGWELMRRDTRAGSKSPVKVLQRGTPPATPGIEPIIVEGMCATLADGKTTRLVFFVNGIQVADVSDRVPDLASVGWFGDLIVRSQKVGTTRVTVTHFEVRNLVV